MDKADEKPWDYDVQMVLDKMKRASRRGTGCHLTAEEIKSLSITIIGDIWEEENPYKKEA